MENAALWMSLGGHPLDLLRTSDPIEQNVLMDILQRANDMARTRDDRFLDRMMIAVQNGIAKAFGGS